MDDAAAVNVTLAPDTLFAGEIDPQADESTDQFTPAFVTSLLSEAESAVADG